MAHAIMDKFYCACALSRGQDDDENSIFPYEDVVNINRVLRIFTWKTTEYGRGSFLFLFPASVIYRWLFGVKKSWKGVFATELSICFKRSVNGAFPKYSCRPAAVAWQVCLNTFTYSTYKCTCLYTERNWIIVSSHRLLWQDTLMTDKLSLY